MDTLIAFVSEHLETLYDLDILAKAAAEKGGDAGRKRVAERFTQTAMAEKHIELYERVIAADR